MRTSRLLVGAAAAVLLVAYAATPAGAVWDPGLGGPEGDRPQHRSGADQHRRRPGRHRVDRSGQQALRPVGALPDHGPACVAVRPRATRASPGSSTPQPIGGGTDLNMYCINILTSTYIGVGYELGDWTGANVNNVGFVARLLNDYFPNTAEPAASPTTTRRRPPCRPRSGTSATTTSSRPPTPSTTRSRPSSTRVRAKGPLVQPPPPSLTITPSTVAGSTGTPTGPFTVTVTVAAQQHRHRRGRQGPDVLRCRGHDADRQRHRVPSGTNIWIQDTAPGTVTLSAAAEATVPTGNVYLYDDNSQGSSTRRS